MPQSDVDRITGDARASDDPAGSAEVAADGRSDGVVPAIEHRREEPPAAEDAETDEEVETELERLVKSRRTEQETDPGVRLMWPLRRTRGSAASSAGTARERSRSNLGADAQAFMSLEIATDD